MTIRKEVLNLIGNKVRKLRKENGLTIAEFAERVDVSTSYISHIETGTVENITVQVLNRIANELDVSLEQLFSEKPKEKNWPSMSYGHPNFDELNDDSTTNIRRYKRAKKLLEEVLTDESISEKARRELAEEIISLIEWAKKWTE